MNMASARCGGVLQSVLAGRRRGAVGFADRITGAARTLATVAALCGLASLPYLNALTADFTFDDTPNIVNNPVVTDGIDVGRVFASPLGPGDLYRPLTMLTFAVDWHRSPVQAGPFHAVNLILHALVTLLVFALAHRLSGSADVAAIAGALFAVHPVHSEAVTNVMGRAELLAALFGVSTLLCAAAATLASTGVRRVAWDFAALLCFSLALLSKESALTVLLLVPLVRIAQRREPLRAGVWREVRSCDWVPYVSCAALFVAARLYVAGGVPMDSVRPLDNVLAFVPWYVRVPAAIGVLWDYFGLLNVPIVLSADYSYPQVPLIDAWYAPRLLAGVALLATAAIVAWRARRPALSVAVVFPFVTLLLTANLLFPIGTIKAERLLYLPSVGWVLVVALLAAPLLRVPRYRRVVGGLLLALVTAFAARTWVRNWDWQDNFALYRSMPRGAPNSAKARYNFGFVLEQQGADEAAAAQYERALYLYEGAENAALGLGNLFDKRGAISTSVEWYRRALSIEPGFDKAHQNLCRGLLLLQQNRDAEIACRNGLRYAPTDANLLRGLSDSLVGQGDLERGVAVLRRAVAYNPTNAAWRQRLRELERTVPECRVETASLSLDR
jgi:tetratricopeptide (TPR) repeat protein